MSKNVCRIALDGAKNQIKPPPDRVHHAGWLPASQIVSDFGILFVQLPPMQQEIPTPSHDTTVAGKLSTGRRARPIAAVTVGTNEAINANRSAPRSGSVSDSVTTGMGRDMGFGIWD